MAHVVTIGSNILRIPDRSGWVFSGRLLIGGFLAGCAMVRGGVVLEYARQWHATWPQDPNAITAGFVTDSVRVVPILAIAIVAAITAGYQLVRAAFTLLRNREKIT